MEVTLVDHTIDPVAKIGLYAGECYQANRTVEACIKRAVKCMEDGHLATLRFAYATFHVEGISRICLAQLTRHVHLSYLVKSQRYVDSAAEPVYWPDTFRNLDESTALRVAKHASDGFELYSALRDEGMKKEDARFVLPQAVTTSLYVTGNFQAWSDFLDLRDSKHAQAEIREVARAIRQGLASIAPQMFGEKL